MWPQWTKRPTWQSVDLLESTLSTTKKSYKIIVFLIIVKTNQLKVLNLIFSVKQTYFDRE